jgi:hypothetical protein
LLQPQPSLIIFRDQPGHLSEDSLGDFIQRLAVQLDGKVLSQEQQNRFVNWYWRCCKSRPFRPFQATWYTLVRRSTPELPGIL